MSREKHTKNVKYPELLDYYYSYEGEKTSYINFRNRFLNLGWDKERAILNTFIKGGATTECKITEYGRECTKCGEFKLWDKFARSKAGINKRTQNCKDCRNKMHREYRNKPGNKDKIYKQKRRKLNIGEYVALLEPVYVDGFPREDIYEVLDYQYKKGYQLRSVLTGYYRNACTGDNPNSIKYYRVERPDFIVYKDIDANSKEKEGAKERAWLDGLQDI